jgi:hypothetical protein
MAEKERMTESVQGEDAALEAEGTACSPRRVWLTTWSRLPSSNCRRRARSGRRSARKGREMQSDGRGGRRAGEAAEDVLGALLEKGRKAGQLTNKEWRCWRR